MDCSLRVAVWGPSKWAQDRCRELDGCGVEASWIGNRPLPVDQPPSSAIVLLDATPTAALALLRRQAPMTASSGVVLLTRNANRQQVLEALSFGISGCAPASIDPSSLRALLELVQRGHLVVEPLLAAFVWEAACHRRASSALRISIREEQVLSLLSRGLSNENIARQLGLSRATVRTHLEHIYQKLEAANRVEAVARAVAGGLL
jgi:two-component system nitrate/nitrite response regulator NarL